MSNVPFGRYPVYDPVHNPLGFRIHAHRARLVVRDPAAHAGSFTAKYGVAIETRPLNLERLFSLLTFEAAPAEPLTRTPRKVATGEH